ncbi:YbfB/YjiJ family MFS transporter [Janthinobacterium sp. GW460P]|uniref:YbfB/YjiJ family MFS transporter n=1 Tax=unclassified Janthinobacterium TaxID=2610881 RepID=UPI000A31F0C7|nr:MULTISPECIES: YbfB/YjiJ family MFS transporter [unclassified Janthinobacterium]MCC7705484.1 YbfB/YjiJ family MFS transporter [Janthinobacterium sp. GW460P]MCC7711068.1 YbfB/YjiJ family MFS transporter [Janthinobacterium sp. GW460W]
MPTHDPSPSHPLATALALSLGAAIALGLSRFSYGLLLPPMRGELGWSYLLAGAMNTFNALGYFLGALATPALMRRLGVWRLLIAGSLLASVFMLMSGLVSDTTALFLQRVCAGVASAFIFIAGGVLAARLGSMHSQRAGFYIGLYYGGTGFGIALSALLVPAALAAAQDHGAAHAWQWPWLALGIACLAATALMALPAKAIGEAPRALDTPRPFAWRDFAPSLAGYFMFGVGYIGYMTFVIALLKQQGMSANLITVFYTVLGLAVVASSRIWARMLDRYRGGESLSILNGVLGTATILPALTSFVPVVFLSGLVFGAVFLSVVASTTALVRHNLPQQSWTAGISAYTTVFALGQIVGPVVVGWIADGPAGLERGLIASAIALFIGAALASRQKALAAGS